MTVFHGSRPKTNLPLKSGVLFEPSHNAHPDGIEVIAPDQARITPLKLNALKTPEDVPEISWSVLPSTVIFVAPVLNDKVAKNINDFIYFKEINGAQHSNIFNTQSEAQIQKDMGIAVILSHCDSQRKLEALDKCIAEIKKQGYRLGDYHA